ncbi:hypothetical protein SRABI05_03750 [Agrobacterium fabrum]|nr:hypothetical protein SRABI46_03722 [Agrobacterium fabrum]CAH0279561.1 hypothetical protein SRABI05_03750 [Agrobacterium fabrum]
MKVAIPGTSARQRLSPGFVSRYIYNKLWHPETVDTDNDEAFRLIDRFTRIGGVTGINYVAPKQLLYALGLWPLANYELNQLVR